MTEDLYNYLKKINVAICKNYGVEESYPFPDSQKRREAHLRYQFFYLSKKHKPRHLYDQDIVDYVKKEHGRRYSRSLVYKATKTIEDLLCVDKSVISNIDKIESQLNFN